MGTTSCRLGCPSPTFPACFHSGASYWVFRHILDSYFPLHCFFFSIIVLFCHYCTRKLISTWVVTGYVPVAGATDQHVRQRGQDALEVGAEPTWYVISLCLSEIIFCYNGVPETLLLSNHKVVSNYVVSIQHSYLLLQLCLPPHHFCINFHFFICKNHCL